MSISDEFFEKGYDAVKAALGTPDGRELLKKEANMISGNKSDIFVILSDDPHLEGRSVQDIADERGIDAYDCLFDLLGGTTKLSFWLGGPRRQDFPGQHSPTIVKNPYVCAGSDELKGDPERPYDWYELQRRGAFPTFMNMYRGYGVPVEEIVRRNTSMVAEHFDIPQRGRLKEGYFADISVIDLDSYSFSNTTPIHYDKPLSMAQGVSHVLVNGQITLSDSALLHPRSGQVLKHQT